MSQPPKFKGKYKVLPVGTRVRIHKPDDVDEAPCWTKGMDVLDQKVMHISSYDLERRWFDEDAEFRHDNDLVYAEMLQDFEGWSFNFRWLEVVEVVEDCTPSAAFTKWLNLDPLAFRGGDEVFIPVMSEEVE